MKRILILLMILISLTAKSYASPGDSPKKTMIIRVLSKGSAVIGKDTFNVDELTKTVNERLWKTYLSTGSIPIRILIQYEGGEAHAETIIAAVRKAQQTTLTQIALQEDKKEFEALSERKKSKLRRRYGVLFQSDFG